MSVAWVGLAVTAGTALYNGSQASRASANNLGFQQGAYNDQMGFYQQSVDYFSPSQMQQEVARLQGGLHSATGFAATAAKVDFGPFLKSFNEAIGTNGDALKTFERRYGPIMDNVVASIQDVSQARLATQGREQLAIDSQTLGSGLREQMASLGITRSGLSVEAERRLAVDTAKQARSIDVNSNAQALQLQAQGVNTLNSMENIRQNIYARKENIFQNRAQGQLQGAMTDANNKTRASIATAANRTTASIANANAYNNIALSGFQAQNSFMANRAVPGTSGVGNAYNNQAAGYQSDANGAASLAGTIFANGSSGGSPKTPTTSTTNGVDWGAF